MTMQALSQAGLYIGDQLAPADPSNPDGHFEDIETVDLHDGWLHAAQSNWCHVGELPGVESAVAKSGIQNIAQRLNSAQRAWGIKDPRACLFLPAWFESLESVGGIFLYRHFASCSDSLFRRHGQDLFLNPDKNNPSLALFQNPTSGLESWLAHNKAIIAQIKKTPDQCVLISHEAMIAGFPLVETINKQFSLHLNERADSRIDKDKITNESQISMPACDPALREELEATWNELQQLSVGVASNTPQVIWATQDNVKDESSAPDSIENNGADKEQIGALVNLWDGLEVPAAKSERQEVQQILSAIDRANSINNSNLSEIPLTNQLESKSSDDLSVSNYVVDEHFDYSSRPDINRTIAQLASSEAIRRFLEEGIKRQPDNFFVHGLLAKNLLASGNMSLARKHFETALASNTDDASVYFQFAALNMQEGRDLEAKHAVLGALAKRRNADHLAVLIRLYLASADFKEAQRLSLHGYEWFPSDERFVLLQADALAGDQQVDTAIAWCEANNKPPMEALVSRKLYELHSFCRHIDEAKHYNLQAQQKQLKNDADYRDKAVDVLLNAGNSYGVTRLIG